MNASYTCPQGDQTNEKIREKLMRILAQRLTGDDPGAEGAKEALAESERRLDPFREELEQILETTVDALASIVGVNKELARRFVLLGFGLGLTLSAPKNRSGRSSGPDVPPVFDETEPG